LNFSDYANPIAPVSSKGTVGCESHTERHSFEERHTKWRTRKGRALIAAHKRRALIYERLVAWTQWLVAQLVRRWKAHTRTWPHFNPFPPSDGASQKPSQP